MNCLHWLFGKIWVEEEIPEDWRHGHLFKLPKKGNLKDCKNWRDITLLSIPGKVFNRILLERMKTEVDRLLREEQAGFQKERSCTDHIAEQSLEWNSPLYITFIDFEKAFNSIDHTALWKLLAHYGIPEKIIRLIHTTYEPSTCQVVHNGSLTEPFSILSWVCQGSLLSPFLFLLAADWIMASTISCQRGIQWTLSKELEDIDFSEDVALLSHRHDNMQDKATTLYKSTAKLGLKIRKKKTRTMRANHVNKNSIQLTGEDIEDVEQFTYLGSVVSRDGGTDRDIKSRIGKATAAFKTLRPIWTSQVISVKTKLRKVVLYACETWRITKALTHKVQTFINR